MYLLRLPLKFWLQYTNVLLKHCKTLKIEKIKYDRDRDHALLKRIRNRTLSVIMDSRKDSNPVCSESPRTLS